MPHDVHVNSLAPGKFELNFRYLIFQIISVIDGWGISCEFALRWMSLHLADDKTTLVQVMAWCHQATSHYLTQCWSRSMSPNDLTRPHWVNVDHAITRSKCQWYLPSWCEWKNIQNAVTWNVYVASYPMTNITFFVFFRMIFTLYKLDWFYWRLFVFLFKSILYWFHGLNSLRLSDAYMHQ